MENENHNDVCAGTTTAEDDHQQTPLLPPTIRHRRRLLDRDFSHTSRGRWNIRREGQQLRRRTWVRHVWDHWFYTISYQRTPILMLILFCTYTLLVVLYASVYWFMSRMGGPAAKEMDTTGKTTTFCNMGISSFMEALYFSLSTMTTIGYGVSDYYFGGCWTPLVIVLMQVCTAVTFDAVSVGLIFQRFSRGHKRSKTILISSDATILRVKGEVYWMFRVAEMRKQALLQTTVRAFLIATDRRKSPHAAMETTQCVTHALRLVHETNSDTILMSLPQVICHKLDETSPLRPPNHWLDAQGDSHLIPLPGEYNADIESLRNYWIDRNIEMIVTVEGTDELTGALIQARHSFTMDNVKFLHRFVPCVDEDATVQFARFHETEPAAMDYPDGYPFIV